MCDTEASAEEMKLPGPLDSELATRLHTPYSHRTLGNSPNQEDLQRERQVVAKEVHEDP